MVYILLANGFEEIEALAPADILRRLGAKVALVGVTGMKVNGAHGIIVNADCSVDDVDLRQADAIVLPGGLPGATNLRDDARVAELLRAQNAAGKVCAAICAAPIVLETTGIRGDRTVTGYPGCEPLSGSAKLHFTGKMVERDGNLITGKGPGAAFLFGREIALALGYPEMALKKLFDGMMIAE